MELTLPGYPKLTFCLVFGPIDLPRLLHLVFDHLTHLLDVWFINPSGLFLPSVNPMNH